MVNGFKVVGLQNHHQGGKLRCVHDRLVCNLCQHK